MGLIVETRTAVRVMACPDSGLRYEARDAGIADAGICDGVQDKGYHRCHGSWRKDSPFGRSRGEAREERHGSKPGPRPATPIDRENDYRSAPVSPAVARSTSDRS